MLTHSLWSLSQLERHSVKLLWLVLLLAAFLRFWHLGAIDHAYFDEINIPQFGYALLNGLKQTPFITAHPPLPHYLFAGAIGLYYQLPWVDGSVEQAWSQIDPLSYRWLTALLGVVCCWFAAAIVKRLTASGTAAVLAALFVATDGVLVVDSRAALNNIILLAFGLASVWAFLNANFYSNLVYRWLWLIFCGVLLGCTVAIKWNGLAFWMLLCSLVLVQVVIFQIDQRRFAAQTPVPVFNGLNFVQCIVALLVLPLLVYWLLWQPYLLHEGQPGFFEIHQRMQTFHTVEVGRQGHPYCSAWYQWPYQGRPMSYLFTPLAGTQNVTAIHLLGNPILYISSFFALLAVTGLWLQQCYRRLISGVQQPAFWFLTVINFGFWTNFLPWMLVKRCLFSYHYEPASVFAFAALAWCLISANRLTALSRYKRDLIAAASLVLLLSIFMAWLYWLPLALGVSISMESFYERMWFIRWI